MLHSASHNTAPVLSCLTASLRAGVTGAAVVALQQRWQQQGCHARAIDRNFGVRTRLVIHRFQFAQTLSLTGDVNAMTWQVLNDAQGDYRLLSTMLHSSGCLLAKLESVQVSVPDSLAVPSPIKTHVASRLLGTY